MKMIKILFLSLAVCGFMTSVAAQSASAAIKCQAKTAPSIDVRPDKARIKYDFTKSKAELNTIDVDTVSPYGANHKTNVGGLMRGTIQLKSNVSFLLETHQHLRRGCVFLNKIDVTISLSPTILIAKEFPKGTCMHNVILAHEYKHVEEDRLVMNKYINLIGRELSSAVDNVGSTYGPMSIPRMQETQEMVKTGLHDIVIRMNDELNAERRKRQQAIDNIDEYEAIGKRCKSRNKPRRR